MKHGGPYKGSRTYPVATPKRVRAGWKRRTYIHDSSNLTPEAFEYFDRVKADGGTYEASLCLKRKIYELKY